MNGIRWGVLVVLSLLALIALPAAAQEEIGSDDLVYGWSPDGQTLLFSSNRDGTSDLYAIDRDGTGLRKLTEGKNTYRALWSPDGKTIELSVEGEAADVAYLLNVADLTMTPVFEDLRPSHLLAWSPDGTALLVWADDVILVNADGSHARNLTEGSLIYPAAAWSPDGKHLMITGQNTASGMKEIFVFNADGSEKSTNLLWRYRIDDLNADYEVTWLSDSTRLAFTFTFDGTIHMVDIATGVIVPLVYTGGMVYNLASTVDGSLVYTVVWHPLEGEAGVYRVDMTDRIPQRLSTRFSYRVSLSPDTSRAVIVSSSGAAEPTTFVNVADGYSVDMKIEYTTILNEQWSPDGTTLAVSLCADNDYDVYLIDSASGDALNMTPDDAFTGTPLSTQCGGYG